MTLYDKELALAKQAALKAGEIQLRYRNNPEGIRMKADRSPVTEIDTQCERIVQDILLEAFPEDGFLGEESGSLESRSGRTWIVDPLDGTRPYIRGIPTHSVLIALEEKGVPVAGVLHLPAMNETYWAQKDGGAFLNGNQIHVSQTSRLNSAMGSALGFIEKDGTSQSQGIISLMKQSGYMYGFMDVYSYGCIAAGRLDFCVNLLDKPWDCAAAACVVKEAGGNYSDIDGNANIHNGSIVLTNGILHDTVLSFFNNASNSQSGGISDRK